MGKCRIEKKKRTRTPKLIDTIGVSMMQKKTLLKISSDKRSRQGFRKSARKELKSRKIRL